MVRGVGFALPKAWRYHPLIFELSKYFQAVIVADVFKACLYEVACFLNVVGYSADILLFMLEELALNLHVN